MSLNKSDGKSGMNAARENKIQVVFVKWGTKYGPSTVRRHLRAIRKHATCDVRIVIVSDRKEPDYGPDVTVKPFPQFAAPTEHLKAGCRLKLAVFSKEILEPGIPALFLDLDTLVRGDVARVADYIRCKGQISLLQGHYLQWWPIQKYVRPFIGEKYYFGNSSAIGFWPEEYYWIFDEFNRVVDESYRGEQLPKKYMSDERFISYVARDNTRVFPTTLIVKFAEEYLTPWPPLESVRGRLPWVRKRRDRLLGVTFVSHVLKPEQLVQLKNGDLIRYKRMRGYWNYPEYKQYWSEPV
ncbi:hypothetical protein [Hoeflea sp. TYP-13]|uniref:hypothetical protein n=1 Tax=Hoeflea sp. TYP-13 TaxID=3230023 RepID=UPI0034C6AC4D